MTATMMMTRRMYRTFMNTDDAYLLVVIEAHDQAELPWHEQCRLRALDGRRGAMHVSMLYALMSKCRCGCFDCEWASDSCVVVMH